MSFHAELPELPEKDLQGNGIAPRPAPAFARCRHYALSQFSVARLTITRLRELFHLSAVAVLKMDYKSIHEDVDLVNKCCSLTPEQSTTAPYEREPNQYGFNIPLARLGI